MIFKKINGIKIYAPSSRQCLIDYAIENHVLLVAVNAEKILHATVESRNIINRNIGYPDGFGATLALKKLGLTDVVKIPGCELWLDIIRAYYTDKSFYLVGGKAPVIEQTVVQLKDEFQGINIVNFRDGYLKTENEIQSLIDDIEEKKPDVVFVAMGSPKQELLMERMQQRHPALYQGLGGSFDVYTGNVKRTPTWWLQNNLEWLYRLIQEPTRIKRQIHLVRFLFLLAIGRFN
ncbi:WecB/TagA/CpsF family glycosyltransferase [Vibrio sp. F13]|uniref:WecB/TagA/CpsF family glycosyltransferase n=1 Tax=Vibrio sp. F13 TaxID=2070777 RepID=UPI0010BDC38E|nr:WecB/TagA/CpsF family glycosyltransferase [Vibrio sp. F13]TKG10171.1 WecB/TagA/CpsF family glycosyltransferase [Vibrio sp. F13]